ncbi:MAG TPA: RHS repeat-associated core domain-containing protein [Chitinophaga sp.]|uniref:RHS repeat-associated core domain-containing protein n=1 Tax=Chitinophaga sp. TaxID=1869181 RepID=UPI002DBFFC5F|nr:RHS repeat-associated core domain-containing protein [Chitinophaga sp.]HEU4551294.1 RHS repeat-associated core domain-containing protein [Chitinophaga sp.]
MLVSNKHFTPVIGLDIHIVLILGVPVPLPHPYIGFVVDPMDYIPFVGATTKINHVPRGKSDTSGIIIILFHIPMGGPFLLAPMIGHDSVNFFGSKKVKVEGNLMSPSGYMMMTCNDIGMPLSIKPGKKFKPIPSMYLPTSYSIPLSFGKPVMVGGPYVPDWAGALLNIVMSFGFGALMKGLGAAGKKLATKFNHALKGKIGSNKLSKFLCNKGLEPVDLVQGIVMYDGTDFELPGPIPLKWTRSWNSDSSFNGILGHGTHFGYDMRIQEFTAENATVVLLGDGRSAVFEPLPYAGNTDYNRHEKLTLTRTGLEEYLLLDHAQQLTYHFRKLHPLDEQYRLYAIRNEAGFMISFHYNSKGCLVQVIDSAGRHLQVTNDSQGRMISVTAQHRGAQQLMVSYAYNKAGDLESITDALGQSTYVQYRNHLMIAKTDRNGQSFYWEYDNKARCIHSRGDGGVAEGWLEYHPEQGYNLFTNSLGHTTTYYYTPDFVVTQVKDPLGNSKFFEYTADFEIYREIDEEANVTGYTYDERGNRTGIVRPDGSITAFNYDTAGRLVLTTSPLGASRTRIYYKTGRHAGLLHTVTEADGSMQVFRYNENNLISKIENESGQHLLLEYDTDHNLTALTLPNGNRTLWEYNAWGKCIRTENPLHEQQYLHYDALGRLTEVKETDGNHISFRYNAYGKILEAADRTQHVKFTYTPLGNIKVREENGCKVHFIYNKEELLTGVVNEHGETYRFIRNDRGDIIRETGFDGATRHYERDAAGRVTKVLRPNNQWTTYEYDYNGNLTRAEYSDGSWEIFSYNRSGQVIEAINQHSTIKLQRDVMGLVTAEEQNGYKVLTQYDRHGRRRQVQSSLGALLQFERNNNGSITGMQAHAPGLANPWTLQIQHNSLDQETAYTFPGQVQSLWNYGKAGLPESHIVKVADQDMQRQYYRWGPDEHLKQLINGLSQGSTQYRHDDRGHLVWAQYENGAQDYRTPDKAGNIYNSPDRKDRAYGPGGRLLEKEGSRYHYDEDGNLVRKTVRSSSGVTGAWEYEWYCNGMLKQVTRPDGKQVTFRYDPFGRRIEKEYNGRVTRFVWDGNVLLHEWQYKSGERPSITINEFGDLQQSHPEPVPQQTLITWVFEERNQAPVAKIQHGRAYAVVRDHLGSPAAAFNEAGEQVWECRLTIYGKVQTKTGTPEFIPLRFPGQYEDEETGLHYNRFRYYDPGTGNYISQDPIKLYSNTLNVYGYVHDPLSWVDLLGLLGRLGSLAKEIADSGDHFFAQKLRTVAVGEDSSGKLFAASSNGLDAGQRAKALELGITPLNSSTVMVDGKNLHAEEVLLKEVDDLKAVGTWKRAPCGPDEHNCLQQLIDKGVKIECD